MPVRSRSTRAGRSAAVPVPSSSTSQRVQGALFHAFVATSYTTDTMGSPDRERSTGEENRMAAMIVVGSILVAIGLTVLYWYGWLDYVVPAERPVIDAVPLLFFLIAIVLTIWGWGRFLSFFE